MDSYQTFDVERLLETSGDDRSLAVELLSLYLELTGKELDRLQIVASIGDNKSIHSIAHKCAGSSITCGMQELADILRELEYASVESVPENLHEQLSRINTLFNVIRTEAEAFIQSVMQS